MPTPDLRNFIANIDEELMRVWDKVEFGSIKVEIEEEQGVKKVNMKKLLDDIKNAFSV